MIMTRKTTKAGPDQQSLAAASAWVARLMSPSATLDDTSAVDAWLDEDPRNVAAWRMACALWTGLGEMDDDPLVAALRAEAATPSSRGLKRGKDE